MNKTAGAKKMFDGVKKPKSQAGAGVTAYASTPSASAAGDTCANSTMVHVNSIEHFKTFKNPVHPNNVQVVWRHPPQVLPCAVWEYIIFIHKNDVINIKEREETSLTQEELRAALLKRLEREKQCWISKATGINKDVLSRFKRGKIDLYDYLFVKLEAYLTGGGS